MKKYFLILFAIPLLMGTCNAQSNSAYQTGTIIFTAVNSAITTLNLSGITPKWQTKYTAGLALITGASQLAYGIYQTRTDFTTLNTVNIAAGTATIITNGILLYQLFHPKKKATSWNIIFSPVNKNSPDFGFRIVKYFKI
jgi:hypothetical protein